MITRGVITRAQLKCKCNYPGVKISVRLFGGPWGKKRNAKTVQFNAYSTFYTRARYIRFLCIYSTIFTSSISRVYKFRNRSTVDVRARARGVVEKYYHGIRRYITIEVEKLIKGTK